MENKIEYLEKLLIKLSEKDDVFRIVLDRYNNGKKIQFYVEIRSEDELGRVRDNDESEIFRILDIEVASRYSLKELLRYSQKNSKYGYCERSIKNMLSKPSYDLYEDFNSLREINQMRILHLIEEYILSKG